MQPKNYTWYYVIGIIIIVLLVGGYFYWKQKQDQGAIKEKDNIGEFSIETMKQKIDELTPPEETSSLEEKEAIKTETFTNSDYGITLEYPIGWEYEDLGGDKNITTPLTRENIAYFYVSSTKLNEDDPTSSLTNVKLIRYVLEDDVEINSQDDWYNYIKNKIDEFVAEPLLSEDYELTNVELGDKIDGKWTVIENYTEDDLLQGKDYYIVNDREMYQFVTKAPKEYFNNYFPQIETIVKSFGIK